MDIDVKKVKEVREKTGAGIMAAKKALEDSNGDVGKAEEILKEQGLSNAMKKSGRETSEGVIQSYIHAGNRIGAMVELNCETDFVGRTPDFKELAHNIAMQVAAMSPIYLNEEDIPSDEKRNPEEICLMKQAFIKDSSKSIGDLILEVRAKVGENIRIGRFQRFGLGE